jgi:hypothetical protein
MVDLPPDEGWANIARNIGGALLRVNWTGDAQNHRRFFYFQSLF